MRTSKAEQFRNGIIPKYKPLEQPVDKSPHFWRAVSHFHRQFLHQSGIVSRSPNETFGRQAIDLRYVDTEVGRLPVVQHRAALGLGRLLGDGQLIVVTKAATEQSLPVGDVFSYTTAVRSIDVAHDITLGDNCEILDRLAAEPLSRSEFQLFLTEMHQGATNSSRPIASAAIAEY